MAIEEIKFGFEQLEFWKKVREFKNEVSKEARKRPGEEKFKLISIICEIKETVKRNKYFLYL